VSLRRLAVCDDGVTETVRRGCDVKSRCGNQPVAEIVPNTQPHSLAHVRSCGRSARPAGSVASRSTLDANGPGARIRLTVQLSLVDFGTRLQNVSTFRLDFPVVQSLSPTRACGGSSQPSPTRTWAGVHDVQERAPAGKPSSRGRCSDRAAYAAVTTTALHNRPPLRRYACGTVASK
jgi:hypothetical protein